MANSHDIAEYYGNPGDIIKGQVTIVNPTEKEKVIYVYQEDAKIDAWINIPQTTYNIKGFHKAVIPYEIHIPEGAEAKIYDWTLSIKELSNPNAMIIEHHVSTDIVYGEYGDTYLKNAANTGTNPNLLHITLAVFAVFVFGASLAYATKCAISSLITKK